MLRPWMIKAFIGVAGFAGGFAAGFLVHKKMNDVKFEEISEEEMSEIEKGIVKQETKQEEEKQENHVSYGLGKAQELPEDTNELRNVLQGKTSYVNADNEQKKAYEKMWKATAEYSNKDNADALPVYFNNEVVKKEPEEDTGELEGPEEEDFDGEFLEQIEREASEAGNNFTEPPHEIDLAEFYNGRPDYDKVTINWFEPDDVWIDDHEDVIKDVESYIGSNKRIFDHPGPDGDIDVRFFRNNHYQTDYEIIRHHRSWNEETGEQGSDAVDWRSLF